MSEPWILTFTGKKFEFLEPTPAMIDIKDIAHALSLQCRFNGHIKDFYSVAEHSVHVAQLVNSTHPQLALEALLHDASEAYMGDMVSPLKALMPEFKAMEARVEKVIADRFGLKYPHDPIIKIADSQLLVDEKNQLHPHPDNYEWVIEQTFKANYGRHFTKLSPVAAEALFLSYYRRASASRSLDTREY